MSKGVGLLRKVAVLIIGIPILIIGIILIPLPGPGLLVCFFGLFILSFEFEFAEKHLQKVKSGLRKIYEESKKRSDKFK